MIRLHLGCGKRRIPGFIHIDRGDFEHLDHRGDVRFLPWFSDSSVDLIYASHLLEYFDRLEAEEVLAEWNRVLKAGGILRVAVPDFEALVRVYREYADLGIILGPLFGRMAIGGGEKAEPEIAYHRTVYDFHDLKRVLEKCGFADVRRYEWRETVHRDHDDHSQAYIPHMDKDHGVLISLNVEATKP